ncbi:HAD IIID h [Fomitiporia mediterranea MF3/22]|uniref:HAD IIID h n=1 Tax=Fomitiporia mediterranea (strain MF3/22) TaxID=694068 RepID=UPI000440841C|nr:HAD IIID h [Fomitiporia mediterranea MF3/22]EJD02204.1 HAD IIID h [Fomitiporia mediterranea MF3/22]
MATPDDQDANNDATVAAEGSVEDVQVASDESSAPEVWIKLKFTWSGKSFDLNIADTDRVYDLKSLLFSMTNVPPDRQKILGLVKGKLPPEEETIANLKLSSGKKFSLVGTPMGDELKDPSQLEELPDVFNDLDVDFSENPQASRAYIADRRNQRKIKEATRMLRDNLTLMHPLREGKKLLVLDIDYTILDTKPLIEGSLPPIECARPKLHEFLEAVYPHYDICIWSQTSWMWLEAKLHELGMIGSDRNNYKINFVLDKTSMFKVFSVRNGQQFPHHVKPLKIIWNLFPQYNASNTIHVDDLGRNFALNPGEGLKISAFKDAHTPRALEDRELEKLARYMVHIASVPDLTTVNHKDWKKVARALLSTSP